MEKHHLAIGKIGEELACKFLRKKAFKILERNVNRRWGELDIVAQDRKTKQIHICEVKTVSGSYASTPIHPGENLTQSKRNKLIRTTILYIQEKRIISWQLDAILIWYNKEDKTAQIQMVQNITN